MFKYNLQFFGGRGASAGIGSSKNSNAADDLVGKSVTNIMQYAEYGGKERLINDFKLDWATPKQITSLRNIFSGILEYDKAYDENKTPFVIDSISIKKIGIEKTAEDIERERLLYGRKLRNDYVMSVSIETRPDTGNAYIRYSDSKYRYALIGSNGGFFTYGDNGKRKSIKPFDIRYGKRG